MPDGLKVLKNACLLCVAVARRHQTTVDDLPRVHEDLARQLADLGDHDGAIARLQQAVDAAETAFGKACVALTKSRKKAAGALDKAVAAELEPLRHGQGRVRDDVDAS